MSDNQSKRSALESLKSQQQGDVNQSSLPLQEQLIEREEIENTPFQLITREKESFIALGKYRVSNYYNSKEEALGALTTEFWEIQMTVIGIIIDNWQEKRDQK